MGTYMWALLCANFGLPRPLCSRLRPDVRDRRRQTSDRRQTASSLNAPAGGGIITVIASRKGNAMTF